MTIEVYITNNNLKKIVFKTLNILGYFIGIVFLLINLLYIFISIYEPLFEFNPETYPIGTEQGWAYRSSFNYYLSSILQTVFLMSFISLSVFLYKRKCILLAFLAMCFPMPLTIFLNY